MPDEDVPRPRRPRRPSAASVLALVALALPFAHLASPHALGAQDSTRVVKVREIRVEVPRPATTTGGSSAVVVDLDSLSVIAAPTMEQLLRRLPLVQIRANSRGEAQPSLRGAEDRQIALLLDGIPLTVGWDHRTDLSIIPMTAVRNVTMLRGLSSMLHGANVLGGAIEFDVARGASLQAPPPRLVADFAIDQEGGASTSAAVGTRIERDFSSWVVRAGAGYRDRPGVTLSEDGLSSPTLRRPFLADRDGRRLNSDSRQVDGFVTTRYQGIGGSWFSGLFTAFDAERGVPPETHIDDPRLWRYPIQTRSLLALSGGTGERTTALGQGDLELTIGLDRSTTEIDEYATATYETVVGGEVGETTTFTGRLLGDHTLAELGEVRSALTVSSVSHDETSYGGDSFNYQQRLWSLGAETEIASQGLFGVGSQGETRWSAGAAVDGADTPASGDKPPLETLWGWGVRAGATTTSAGGDVVYHAGLSRRTRFPSLRELYSGALGRFDPNPELGPERLIAAEAGITVGRYGGQFQVVAFHHRLSDGIVRTSIGTAEGGKFKRVNRDRVTSTGIELLASGGWERFTYGGDLTLQRVRIEDPGIVGGDDRAEYEPSVAGKLNVGAGGPAATFWTAFLRFRGRQFCQNAETRDLDRLSRSTTLDLEVAREFAVRLGTPFLQTVDARLAMANVGDALVLDQCGLPQPGRTLRLQLNLR